MASSVVISLSSSSLLLQASAILTVLISLSVLVNILFQCVAKSNENKPPLVFHYFPIIGSTISYGKDPMVFFERCRQKVSVYRPLHPEEDICVLTMLCRSTEMYLHSSSSDDASLFTLEPKETTLC